jgi:predicted nuclease of predicted toxin-antitoxin system
VNLVADEGVDRPVVDRPRLDGHHVVYVAELSPGLTDEEVLRRANEGGAVLLTADQDFSEVVFRQGLVHPGAILLRLAGLAGATKAEIVSEVCRTRATESIGAFSVVSPGQVRIRRRP